MTGIEFAKEAIRKWLDENEYTYTEEAVEGILNDFVGDSLGYLEHNLHALLEEWADSGFESMAELVKKAE